MIIMPLTTRKKTSKKAGATIEEELPGTRYGKGLKSNCVHHLTRPKPSFFVAVALAG